MQPLKVGSTGPLVEQWEIFLRGQTLLTDKEVDTNYTEATKAATVLFQSRYPQLNADGVAGNHTIGYAMAHHGFELFELSSPDFPAQPPDAKTLGFAQRQKILGEIKFTPAPTPDNPEAIRITNDWKKLHLTAVSIPQLKGVSGASSGVVDFNKAAAGQLQALFQDWEKEGLLRHVVSWGGTFAPRFIRGSRTTLSQHCLPADQTVWTPEGVAHMGDMRNFSGSVWAYSQGVAVPAKVVRFFDNGRKPLLEVRARGHRFKCTPDHPVMVLRKRTLPSSQWEQHSEGRGQKRALYWTEMVDAGQLVPGDRIVTLAKTPDFLQGLQQVDLGWAEALGLFIGDGCIHHRHGKPEYMSFSIPESDRIREHARGVLTRTFGHAPRHNNKALLYYRDEIWQRFLPFDKKAREKTIPDEVWSWTAEAQCAFLLGYIYSDGTVKESKSRTGEGHSSRYVFKAGSKLLMEGLKLLVAGLGFRAGAISVIPGTDCVIRGGKAYSGECYAFGAVDVHGVLAPDADSLYRERVRRAATPDSGRSHAMGYETVSPDFTHRIVQSVEPAGSSSVFDIEVEGFHNFITDGAVVSNCHASAFDMNVPWNALGARGALIGDKGSVRELVLTAYRHGFFWGGWYKNRKDPMHFEVFRV